jgi:hypothetical protein
METTVTTLPPERFHPYTPLEYAELKEVIQSITTHIPTDRMGWIWSNHNKISKTAEPQPCSCGSAASHWKRATQTIRDFVNKVEGNV